MCESVCECTCELGVWGGRDRVILCNCMAYDKTSETSIFYVSSVTSTGVCVWVRDLLTLDLFPSYG